MTRWSIDFSCYKQRSLKRVYWIVLMLLLFISIAMVVEHRRIETASQQIKQLLSESQPKEKPVPIHSEFEMKQINLAKRVQNKLNFPWQELWSALETVKHDSEHVILMAIQPDLIQSEIQLSAQAPSIKDALAFVDLLENEAVLYQVVVLNQRQLSNDPAQQGIEFTLKMRWKL